jgi:hypothetical protein
MKQARGFEDLLPAWQAYARALAGAPLANGASETFQSLQGRIASACPGWLAEQGAWPNRDVDMAMVATDVRAALVRLSGPPATEAEDSVMDAAALAAPAAVGSALGALALSPLTLLWFDNRAIGLALGGVLGAYLVVRVIGMLLDRPGVLAAAQRATAIAGGGIAINGVWRAIRGLTPSLFKSAAWLVAVPFLLTLVRPTAGRRPSTSVERARKLAMIDRAAALALALCWSNPDRLPPAPKPKGAEPLPGPVWDSLVRLKADLARNTPIEDLRDSCEDLFQRCQEAGYDWKSAPPGAPYDNEMAEAFDTFGLIAPGQPIRTSRAALTRNGEVIRRGEVKRV